MIWSCIGFAGYFVLASGVGRQRGAVIVAAAVFSHWLLDLIVHRPDLPLYDDTWKVGLGLWNRPMLALVSESALLAIGVALYLRGLRSLRLRIWTIAFALIMLGAHTVTFFGAPPASPAAAAITALVAYAVFAGGASLLEKA